MELHHLRAFLAVVEEGSVTAGARRLFLTQPAVTRQLQLLERHYDTPLLTRTPSGVVPTRAGLVLEREARRLLARAADLQARLSRVPGGWRDGARLTIGLHDEALGVLTNHVIGTFRQIHPDVAVSVRQVTYAEIDTCLELGRVDVLLTTAGSTSRDTSAFHPLFKVPMLAAVPKNSEQAHAPVLTAADVLELPLFRSGPVHERLSAPFTLASFRNSEAPQVVEGPDPQNAVDLFLQVAHNDAFLALEATAETVATPFAAVIPLIDVPPLATGVTTRPGLTDGEPDAAFVDVAKDVVRPLLPLMPFAIPAVL